MLEVLVANTADVPAPVTLTLVPPDDAGIDYSDYASKTTTSDLNRFSRPVVDGQGYEYCAPGARIRVKVAGRRVLFKLRYNHLVIREDARNFVGAVYVDGVFRQTFTSPTGILSAADVLLTLYFNTDALRTIEIVMPYGDAIDFLGYYRETAAAVSTPAARPSTVLMTAGDSITHGFYATDVTKSWPFLVGVAKDWQVINEGYGGRLAIETDGTDYGANACDILTYMIGYNDFVAQTPLADYKDAVKGFVTSFRATSGHATTPIYLISPIYSPNTAASIGHSGGIELSEYRTQVSDAVTELTTAGDANVHFIDGLSLVTNDSSYLEDGIHPNNPGSADFATNIEPLLSV